MTFTKLVEEIVAQANVDRKIRPDLPLVLHKSEILGLGIRDRRVET